MAATRGIPPTAWTIRPACSKLGGLAFSESRCRFVFFVRDPWSSVPSDPHSAASNSPPSTSGLDDLRSPIEAALNEACVFGAGCPTRLAEAMRYALLAPGKRLRPAMVLMACEAVGGDFSQGMPGAVAVEMIHAYSLIHDDLPAMDDDDLRRGRPTVHIKFDQATAILAGDGLLAQAFVHLAHEVSDADRASEAVRVLSMAAGPSQLVGGQSDDLSAEDEFSHPDGNLDPEEIARRLDHLETIHRRKTGALFSASLQLGAILAGASRELRDALSDYADDIGLAFQVVDDLLDETADSQTLGKRAGKDADRGKLTYPGLLGLEGARQKATQLIQSAQEKAAVFGASGWRLSWLAEYILERSH